MLEEEGAAQTRFNPPGLGLGKAEDRKDDANEVNPNAGWQGSHENCNLNLN